jgi:hypothetical protein
MKGADRFLNTIARRETRILMRSADEAEPFQ